MARNKEEAKLRKKQYDKKRREDMKNNPEKLEEMREKERQKYKRKRVQGKLSAKLVANMSDREHRQIKKEWRKRSKNYRKSQKDRHILNRILEDNSPPPSPVPIPDAAVTPTNSNLPTPNASTSRRNVGRKRIKKSRSKMCRTIQKLNVKLTEYKKSSEKYRKRWQRLKEKKLKTNAMLSSNSKVNQLLGKEKVSQPVRRKLIFGEVVERQLQENYRTASGHTSKKKYHVTMQYNMLKKYRLLNEAKKIKIVNPQSLKTCNRKIRPSGHFISSQVKEGIRAF